MTRAARRAFIRAVLVVFLLSVVVAPAGTIAAEPEFPPGATGYHTYLEMADEVATAATDHPDIVRRFSIGRSQQGRELWAVKAIPLQPTSRFLSASKTPPRNNRQRMCLGPLVLAVRSHQLHRRQMQRLLTLSHA